MNERVFFFNDTATTEIYTLSLHDALPIFPAQGRRRARPRPGAARGGRAGLVDRQAVPDRRDVLRSEEHTSELQSRQYLVCRLLLEKKKQPTPAQISTFSIVHVPCIKLTYR